MHGILTSVKLSDAIDQFRKYTNITKSIGTQEYYKYYLSELENFLGDVECKKIDNKAILNVISIVKNRNNSISNASLNKYIITLKTVIKYATGIEIKFTKLKERKKIIPTISRSTYSKIFEYFRKHMRDQYDFRNYVFLKLLLDTGLRLHEIINIKLKDIDFNTSSIHIKVTKTDVDRYVGFTESTKQLMIKFVVTQKIDKYLFYDFKTNRKMTTSSVECFIYRLKKKLDIDENITPHKWRHTFATNYLNFGGNLETLRLLLGHSNLKTTQKYLHLSKTNILANYQNTMQQMAFDDET